MIIILVLALLFTGIGLTVYQARSYADMTAVLASVSFRDILDSDDQAILNLINESMNQSGTCFHDFHQNTLEDLNKIKQKESWIIAQDQSGNVVGFSAFTVNQDGVAVIDMVCVKDKNKDLYTYLIQKTFSELRDRGIQSAKGIINGDATWVEANLIEYGCVITKTKTGRNGKIFKYIAVDINESLGILDGILNA